MSLIQISGQWIAGPNAGERSTLSEVRAGLIFGLRADGSRIFGDPEAFVADTGETGEAVLRLLLPNPKASTLVRGAAREALAAAYSVATLGRQETRAWDQSYIYIIDNGEGDVGVVQFDLHGASGAFSNHHFQLQRKFAAHDAVALAPVAHQGTLRSLVNLPIFQQNERSAITSVFWTDNGLLCGPEAWHKVYTFGCELLRHELLEDHDWAVEASEYYALSSSLVATIIQITDRLVPLNPLPLKREEFVALVPQDAPFHADAVDQLFSGGVFTPP